jgi:hypothetical protein
VFDTPPEYFWQDENGGAPGLGAPSFG